MGKGIGRREFVKGIAATGLAVAGMTALSGCRETTSGESINWNEEADVVVIGSGFAGLAAAIEARNANASVKVIEKMPTPGGNSIINGGAVAVCGSPLQEQQGIKDSVDLMVEDMLKAGLYLNHVEKARMVAEKSREVFDWTVNYLGVKYSDQLVQFGGHSVPRSYKTINHTGADIIKKMLEKLKELGVKVETKRKFERFIQNSEGRVIGVEVRDGYKFGDENSGTPVFIKAKRGVVLASGGFANDVKMRILQDPRLSEDFMSTNHQGATGEAMREAFKIGAVGVQLSWIQLGPWASPDEPGFGVVPQFSVPLYPYAPIVDSKTGKRFISELSDRKQKADAIIANGAPAIHVCDSYSVKKVPAKFIDAGLKNGSIKKFDTLKEVAEHYGMPVDSFLAEIERYNSFIRKGKDEDFGVVFPEDAKPLSQPPFYAARLWPKVHHCMGGIATTEKGEVLHQDGHVIKGLFAAGEVAGGTHGACRLGSVAVADCLVFGRITGKLAAQQEPWA